MLAVGRRRRRLRELDSSLVEAREERVDLAGAMLPEASELRLDILLVEREHVNR